MAVEEIQGTLIGQISGTPVVDGYDCIDVTIIKTGTEINQNFAVKYDDLTDAQRACVDSYTQMLVDLAPKEVVTEKEVIKK